MLVVSVVAIRSAHRGIRKVGFIQQISRVLRKILRVEKAVAKSTGRGGKDHDWIVRLNAEGITILLVSHDMGLMTVAHTVHTLYFGEIVASGDMATIQRDPRVREVYLGV